MSAGTKGRRFRIDDELMIPVKAKAERLDTNVSEVIRELLTKWLAEPEPKGGKK